MNAVEITMQQPAEATARPMDAIVARLQRAPFWPVWPSIVALTASLSILVIAGGLVLHARLVEMRSASAMVQAGPAGSTLPPALSPEAFTLTPAEIRPLEPDDARAFNDAIPFSTLPVLAAKPFFMTPADVQQYSRALDCMTAAIYYEAANETPEGQAAVAQVVINRMRHPAYPHTICGVVFQGSDRVTGCQFSFTCDGSMARIPPPETWARLRAIAAASLNGKVAAAVGMATHYHADYVAPYWAERLVKMRKIGAHIFYRWTGSWGLPIAFNRAHAGEEPVILKMAALATPLDLVEPVIDPLAPVDPLPEVVEAPPPPHVVVATTPDKVDPTPATVVAPPPVQPAPVIANPLSAAPDARPPRRSRIAVPSGW